MKNCLILLLLVLSVHAIAQREYLVEVDPVTGNVAYHTTLPDINYIFTGSVTVNYNKSFYTFAGIDFNKTERLYTVDLANKQMLYNPPGASGNWPLQYDNSNNKLYSIKKGGPLNTLVSIEPQTGAISTISSGYGCTSSRVTYSTYDDDTHTIYSGCIDNSTNTASIIKTNTVDNPGTFTSTISQTNSDMGIAFHQNSKRLFAFLTNKGACTLIEYGANGTYTELNQQAIYYRSNVINQDKNQMVLIGFTDTGSPHTSMKAITYLLPTGTMISSVNLPALESQYDNLHSIAYNKSDKKYYMLHWDHDTTTTILNIKPNSPVVIAAAEAYPSPFTGKLSLQVKTPVATNMSVIVYNAIGMKVYSSVQNINPGTSVLPIIPEGNNLSAGTYFISVSGVGERRTLRVTKIE